MSLVSVAEVRARNVGGELSDDALQAEIDAAEAYLARHIGPLSGSRTEKFYPRRGYEPLYLRRPAPSVTVDDDGTAITLGEDVGEFRLLYSGSVIELIDADWIGPVQVTYTPDDEVLVKQAVISLIRLNTADGPYVSERIGDYSYQKAQGAGTLNTARRTVIDDLLPKRPFRSERIVASTYP